MAEELSTAVSTAVSAAPEAKWFDAFDADIKNYMERRGLIDKDPSAAFLDAVKSHREAEAYMGVPKEQLLKLPKADAPPEEWDAVYTKLGYSTNADDYKLDGLKFSDGTDVDDGFKDFVRTQVAELKLPPAAATKFAEATLKHMESGTAAKTADETAAATKGMEQLRQSWGANFEANKVIADNAYTAIMSAAGFDQATMTKAIQQLGAVSGKAEVMQMLLSVGQKLGEDKFVGGGGPGGGLGPRNSEQAVARIAELKGDETWVKRYLAGGTAENKEMNDLHTLAYGPAQ